VGQSTELVGHGAFYDVDYSPDGRLIAVASTDDNVYLWEVTAPAGGDFTASEPRVLVGHTHDVYSVDFSPDSRYLASGAWDTRVLLWSTETFTSVAELEHQE
jgi:WD40 repeat protein